MIVRYNKTIHLLAISKWKLFLHQKFFHGTKLISLVHENQLGDIIFSHLAHWNEGTIVGLTKIQLKKVDK